MVRSASTVRDAVAATREAFDRAGIADAALDARILVADALGMDATGLIVRDGDAIEATAAARLAAHVRRRVAGEPVARILGRREFWGLSFRLSPETLEPRPDTETVVEAALARVADRAAPLRLLDLGTGSGCILVALLHELAQASGIGIDRAEGAARMAALNAAANGVGDRAAFLCGDWGEAIAGRFDLVVSNPPYIAPRIIAGLAREVLDHDPRLALDGGEDGLDAYRAILGGLARLLAPGGSAVLEIGYDQTDPVRGLADATGFAIIDVRRDLAGRPRCVTLVQREALVDGKSRPI